MSKRKSFRQFFRAVAKRLPVNLRLLFGIKLRKVKKKGAPENEIKVRNYALDKALGFR